MHYFLDNLTFREKQEAVIVDILYLGGLVVLALGYALYLYCRWARSKLLITSFRCVHHVTASGEPISFLLTPRDTTETDTTKP